VVLFTLAVLLKIMKRVIKFASVFFCVDLLVIIAIYFLGRHDPEGFARWFLLLFTQTPYIYIWRFLMQLVTHSQWSIIIMGLITWSIIGGFIGAILEYKKYRYWIIGAFSVLIIIIQFYSIISNNIANQQRYNTNVIYAQAINTLNPSLCESISNHSQMTQCKTTIAERSGNIAYCDSMPLIESHYNKFVCYEIVAKVKNDASICNGLSTDSVLKQYIDECKKEYSSINLNPIDPKNTGF